MKKFVAFFLIVATLAVSSFFALNQIKPPFISAQAAQEKGYQNVLSHAQNIAGIEKQETIKQGTPLVQEYIAAQIESLGITPTVQAFTKVDIKQAAEKPEEEKPGSEVSSAVTRNSQPEQTATIDKIEVEQNEAEPHYNIMAKVETPSNTNAILFVAHYNSSQNSGNRENALAVSSMLQLMQSLAQRGAQQTNDVYFLFTEGEGEENLGVQYFLLANPEYRTEIRLVFSFESQTGAETLLMLQTSEGESDLLPNWLSALAQPLGFSLSSDVYSSLPTNDGFSRFLKSGYQGMSFASLGKEAASDSAPPPKTVYQYYKTVLSLGEYYAKLDMGTLGSKRSAVYFPFFWGEMVVMPYLVVYALAFVPLLLAVALLVMELRRKQVQGIALIGRCAALLAFGIVPTVMTLIFPPAGYLFFVPALLFLPVQFFLTIFKVPRKSIVMAFLMMAVLVTTMLYLPVIYLAQYALANVAITLLLCAMPVLLITIYSARTLWAFRNKALT